MNSQSAWETPCWPIDKNAQHPAPPGAQQLDVDDFDPFRTANSLGDFGDLSDNFFFANHGHWSNAIKKWAFAH